VATKQKSTTTLQIKYKSQKSIEAETRALKGTWPGPACKCFAGVADPFVGMGMD